MSAMAVQEQSRLSSCVKADSGARSLMSVLLQSNVFKRLMLDNIDRSEMLDLFMSMVCKAVKLASPSRLETW